MIAEKRKGESFVEPVSFLKGVPLFMEFEIEDLHELQKAFRSTHYGAGDVILDEGRPNRALHIVRDGRVTVSRRAADGEFVPLSDLVEGQTFGELSIIEDGVVSARLHAVSDSDILSISMDDLAAFLRTRPAAEAKFWRQISIDLRRRLLQTNDVVRNYFEANRALVDNPTFRQVYAMCNK